MGNEFIDTLQELINSICDRLYAERQLITKQTVKKLVLLHENWVADENHLDQAIPQFINTWRLHNLDGADDLSADSISVLNAQLCKYKSDLYNAQQSINQLQDELIAKNNEVNILRKSMIKELRGLLDV